MRRLRRFWPIAKFLAQAALVVACAFIVAGLVLAVASFHVMSAPYRWTREAKGDRAARLEATTALIAALYALYQTRRKDAPSNGD